MNTARLFVAHLTSSRTTPVYHTRRRQYSFLGVSGTAREWMEDGLTVVAGMVLVVILGAVLALVTGR